MVFKPPGHPPRPRNFGCFTGFPLRLPFPEFVNSTQKLAAATDKSLSAASRNLVSMKREADLGAILDHLGLSWAILGLSWAILKPI